MLRGIFHGLKLAAPLLALLPASQLFAADTATKAVSPKQNAAIVAPAQNATNKVGKVATGNPTTTKAATNQQAGRRYYRHHRGHRRHYVNNAQNMPRKNMTAGQQFNNSKNIGKVATQPVKHHNATTHKPSKQVHKASKKA
jgi:hypothetical protein